jgi:apolipoprotein N-acyltransferase
MSLAILKLPHVQCLIAGVLFALAFSPFNFSYLAIVGLSLLFNAWHDASKAQAFFRGYLFGLGSFGFGVSWVFVSIHDFGGGGLVDSSLLTALFVIFWSIFPALAGLLAAITIHTKHWLKILTLPLLWVLIEYLRGVITLNGFPWLLSAYSQLDSPLSGYIPLVGAYGTGFLVALTASIIVHCFIHKKLYPSIVSVLVIIWLSGGLLQYQHWTTAVGQPIKATLIQGNVTQDQKWRPEAQLPTLLTYQLITESNWDSQIIIWPESAIPAYLHEVLPDYLMPLHNKAVQHNTDLIISVPINDQINNKKYNAVVTFGKNPGIYRKTHLLPFGEYLPLQPLSGYILNLFKMRLGSFEPGGDQQPLLKAGGYPFITSICYEDAFGTQANSDIGFLVNVTNDAWFGKSVEPYQHLQIARMRALETGRYLLRASNTGITAIIDPEGQIVKQLPLFTTTALTGSITAMTGSTPYSKLGDNNIVFGLGSLFILLLAIQWLSAKFTKTTPRPIK